MALLLHLLVGTLRKQYCANNLTKIATSDDKTIMNWIITIAMYTSREKEVIEWLLIRLFQKIEDFRFDHRFQTRADATTELIRLGLEELKKGDRFLCF